ncbi:uncharacterized protein H6S33_008809, partial [Morchella sextelata]|uniref:uncharacterized protein n=1 Tax=Morchella sextelata TaxID=1174677 RepID=UPI001D056063
FAGDPTHPRFDDIAPAPSCATIYSVGKVVGQPKGTIKSLPIGWRSFDLRSSYYDLEAASKSASRKYFVIRWYIPAGKRWESTKLPQIDSVIQITGKLVGRVIVDNASSHSFLGCIVSSLNYISVMQSGLGGGSVGETSSRSESKNVGRSWGARDQKRSAMDDSSLYSSSPPPPKITVSLSSISKPTTPAKKKALSVSNDCSVDDEFEEIGDDIIGDVGSE